MSFCYLESIRLATISLSFKLYPAHSIWIMSLLTRGSFWSQVESGDMFLSLLDPSWTRMLYLAATLMADLLKVISRDAIGLE